MIPIYDVGNVRQQLTRLLSDGNTVANYQPGVGVTGALNASAWANQIGAAGALDGTGHATIYLPYSGQKYLYCSDTAANYVSTPNAAANQIIGDMTIIVHVVANDWTPIAETAMIGKWGAAGHRGYLFTLRTDGKLNLYISSDGTLSSSGTSSVATGITDGTGSYIKAVRTASTGAVVFSLSQDGVTYTTLGTPATTTAGNAFNSDLALEVGSDGGGADPWSGYIYRAQLYSGSTLAVDFNAADWTETSTNGATQVSSTTGETWTLNNTAIAKPAAIIASPYIITDESAGYMKATYTAIQPRTYYLVGMDPLWTSGKYVMDGVTANTLGLAKTTGTPKVSINAGSAAAENAGFTLRAKHVLTIVLNGASSSTAIDGVAAVTGNAGAGNPGGLTIGADGGALNLGGFWFQEIIDRSGADSAATQVQIRALLKSIYGTP